MPRRLIAAFLLSLAAVPAHAGDEVAAVPVMTVTPLVAPYSATYTITRGRMRVGEMHTELSVSPHGSWTYRSVAHPRGLAALVAGSIEETSEFMVVDDRLVPVQHDYRMPDSRRNRDFSLRFDRENGTVEGEVRGEPVTEALPDGAVDRHSMPIAVMLDLAAGRSFPRLQVMVDRGRMRELETRIDGEEQVTTPAGEFDTVRIVQQRLDDPTRRYLVWVVQTDDGPLPVRISSVDDDGTDVLMELVSVSR